MSPSELKQVEGHCPACGPDRQAIVVGEHRHDWSIDEADIHGTDVHRILKCCGCSAVYFQKHQSNSESYDHDDEGGHRYFLPTITYWPPPSNRRRPGWFQAHINLGDADLSQLLSDVYTALDHDLGVLAAIGIRTTFDRASELLKVDPDLGFYKKLQQLQSDGKIGQDELAILDALTDAGNAAAHRGWRPDKDQLDTMMEINEGFLFRSFVLPGKAKALKSTVPPRPLRKADSA